MAKEFKFKPMSKRNRNRTILYAFMAVISAAFLNSIPLTLVFAGLTAANYMLTQKSKANEQVYAEKLRNLEKELGGEMTEDEKATLHKYIPEAKKQNAKDIQNLIDELSDDEDEFYEEYEAAMAQEDDDEGVEDDGRE